MPHGCAVLASPAPRRASYGHGRPDLLHGRHGPRTARRRQPLRGGARGAARDPAPRLWHQELTMRLLLAVSEYLNHEPVGHLLPSPADISWGPDVLVQPDLFVAPLEQVRTLDWRRVQDLLLVIEVLSPSSTRADRFTKRRLYQ